jgi:hypothetical protein
LIVIETALDTARLVIICAAMLHLSRRIKASGCGVVQSILLCFIPGTDCATNFFSNPFDSGLNYRTTLDTLLGR